MNKLVGLKKKFEISSDLKKLVSAINDAGGCPIAVGGCVRDHLLGHTAKDIDIEVHGLDLQQLEKALKQVSTVHPVGRSFGVLKVAMKTQTGSIFDVSLPRKESKSGRGHRGFVITTDPNLEFPQASARRDFTINAIGYDLKKGVFLDPHGGISDLENSLLRHVSDAFDEDPLRVFRACQFAARFELQLADATIEKCRRLKDELPTLSIERIFEEFKKLLLATKPSIGIDILRQTEALFMFEELEALIDCPQDEKWHPEGDVWVHTLMVVDEAAGIVRREALMEKEALIIVLGALCHDLGKPLVTQFEDGRHRSKGHESAGEKPTKTFLEKIGMPQDVVSAVLPLVREHLKPFQLYAIRDEIKDGAIRRLARRVPIDQLCLVAESDFLGRTTPEALTRIDPSTAWLREKAKDLAVEKEGPKPILMGRHLLDDGYKPGPKMGEVLEGAYEAQLDGEFADLAGALAWLKRQDKE